jgi:hypothetical protein
MSDAGRHETVECICVANIERAMEAPARTADVLEAAVLAGMLRDRTAQLRRPRSVVGPAAGSAH